MEALAGLPGSLDEYDPRRVPTLEELTAQRTAAVTIAMAGYDIKHVYLAVANYDSDILMGRDNVPSGYALFIDDRHIPWTAVFTHDEDVLCIEGW